MFGILGAAIFGVIYMGAWSSANKTEQRQRENSKKNNLSFYCDKNGKMRHVSNGKKFTTEEIHNYLNPNSISLKDKMDQIKKERHDEFDHKYYVVYNAQDHYKQEIFLTKEEAERYVYENYTDEDCYFWKIIGTACKHTINSCKNLYHLNFDERSW